MLLGSSSFTKSGYSVARDWAHTNFGSAAVRAIIARCAILNAYLPGGMWCTAMLAGAATLPCGNIARGCCHSIWGCILASFIHPLLHQVWSLFSKGPMSSTDQPHTWTARHGNQTQNGMQHSVWHGAPDGFVIPLLLQIWPLFYKDITAPTRTALLRPSGTFPGSMHSTGCRCTPHVLIFMEYLTRPDVCTSRLNRMSDIYIL